MAVVIKGTVTQGIPANGVVPLTYVDESTGLGTVTSRILNVYSANGVLLDTVDITVSLTAIYNTPADGYFSFIETVIDNTGTYNGTENFVCTAFYMSIYAPAIANIATYCGNQVGQILNYSNAQNNRYAAIDAGVFGQGVLAQGLVTYANFLLTTPYYATQ